MRRLLSSIPLAVAFAYAGLALDARAQSGAAADCRPNEPAAREAGFGRLDKDGDGALSHEEYAACQGQEAVPSFAALDGDADGKLGKAEFSSGDGAHDATPSPGGALTGQRPAPQRMAQGNPADTSKDQAPTSSGATRRSSVSAATGSSGAANAMMGMKARDLIGRQLVNASGKELGEIDDIVMNEQDSVIYAVVGVGGFLGLGEKSVAIPFEQLRLGADNVILMSEKGASDLKQLPRYKAGQWRSLRADQTLSGR